MANKAQSSRHSKRSRHRKKTMSQKARRYAAVQESDLREALKEPREIPVPLIRKEWCFCPLEEAPNGLVRRGVSGVKAALDRDCQSFQLVGNGFISPYGCFSNRLVCWDGYAKLYVSTKNRHPFQKQDNPRQGCDEFLVDQEIQQLLASKRNKIALWHRLEAAHAAGCGCDSEQCQMAFTLEESSREFWFRQTQTWNSYTAISFKSTKGELVR